MVPLNLDGHEFLHWTTLLHPERFLKIFVQLIVRRDAILGVWVERHQVVHIDEKPNHGLPIFFQVDIRLSRRAMEIKFAKDGSKLIDPKLSKYVAERVVSERPDRTCTGRSRC